MEKIKGVIEGYYGKPWTSSERMDILKEIAAYGFNTYMYSPKHDPYHRLEWKTPYPEDLKLEIEDLFRHVDKLGMDFYFLISPGIGLVYSSENDLDLLVGKIRKFHEAGIRNFGVCFDDISMELTSSEDREKYDDIGTAQNSFLKRVYEKLITFDQSIKLVTCPTMYFGRGDSDYIRKFCLNLPAEISVFWTGREVCSQTISAADTEFFTKSTGHRPLYWDNYPVNDSVMKWELHLAPYDKRDPEIMESSDGVVINVMEFPYLSLIPLKTVGDFFQEGNQYDPLLSWERAIGEIIPSEFQEAFFHFAKYNFKSCIYPYFSNIFIQREFVSHMGDADWDFRQYIEDISKQGRRDYRVLMDNKNTQFVREALPWIQKLKLLMNVFACYRKKDSGNPVVRFFYRLKFKFAFFRYRLNQYEIFQLSFFEIMIEDRKSKRYQID